MLDLEMVQSVLVNMKQDIRPSCVRVKGKGKVVPVLN
jgi:hypothetical protein